MFKKLLILFSIVISQLANCQTPVHFTIGKAIFANTDIYSVFHDSKNDLIYAGTNNGLYVYKHNKFILLKGPSEQIGNSFFSIKQNNDGEIYCKNLNGQIFKIDEKTNTFKIFYELENGIEKVGVGLLWYFFTSDNELITVTRKSIKLHAIDETNHLLDLTETPNKLIVNCKKVKEEVFFHVYDSKTTQSLIYRLKNSKVELFDAILSDNFFKDGRVQLNYFFGLENNTFYIDLLGSLSSEKNGVKANFVPFEKERYMYLSDSTFIGLNSQKGYRYFKLKDKLVTSSSMLMPELFVSAFHKSTDNTQLFGTFGSGILVFPNPKIVKKNYDYLFLGIATSPDNQVAVSTRSGEVFSVNENGLKLIEKTSVNVDDVWYVGESNYGHDFIYDNPKKGVNATKDVKVINEDVLMIANMAQIYLRVCREGVSLGNIHSRYGSHKLDKLIFNNERFSSVNWNEKDSMFYYSTNFGVYSRGWSGSKINEYLLNNEPFQSNDLLLHENELVCATTDHGILFYNEFNVVSQISEKNGLKSNNVEQIDIRNNILFILSKDGFQAYDLRLKNFIPIGISDGLTVEEVTKFAVSKDKLWLLEKHGYYDVNISDLQLKENSFSISNLYVDSICVNGKVVNSELIDEFDYMNNHFEFYFDYRDVVTKQETEILYTLEGFYDDWKSKTSYENKVEFQSLPPGNYVFKIKAKRRLKESNWFVYEFKIKPPFWQAWWFYIIIGLVLVVLVTVYFRIRIRKIKKDDLIKLEKQKLLTDAIDSKLKALRSQMNPHFIFNSLNSIQALILRKDTEKSYDYVVMFADLVRKTLRYSDRDFIDIEEEIEFLETYLKLESLRMKNDFKFEINYNFKKDIQIPSLMVQPFIENAIHHGLLHKEGRKLLSINFEFEKEMTCTIIDNGIGREKAKEIRERQHKTHKSFSLEATKQRMKIIEQQHEKSFGYEFFDEVPSGTKVILKIPFKYKY